MGELVQLVVSGVATGAIYSLAALGFTLLWQASGTIDFAQGEFVMLPAFAMLFCVLAGMPLWLGVLAACAAAMIVLGWGFKRLIVDPLIRHGVIPLVIATLGLSTFLKTTVRADGHFHSLPTGRSSCPFRSLVMPPFRSLVMPPLRSLGSSWLAIARRSRVRAARHLLCFSIAHEARLHHDRSADHESAGSWRRKDPLHGSGPIRRRSVAPAVPARRRRRDCADPVEHAAQAAA